MKAIVDFTSSKKELMEEAVRVLAPLNPDVYIFVGAAAVYDVSDNPKHVSVVFIGQTLIPRNMGELQRNILKTKIWLRVRVPSAREI